MKPILSFFCLAGFFILPFVVLGIRTLRPKRMPWWLGILGLTVTGWLLVFLMAVLTETPDARAAKVFALSFGWIYPLVWFAPWLIFYGLVHLGLRLYGDRNG